MAHATRGSQYLTNTTGTSKLRIWRGVVIAGSLVAVAGISVVAMSAISNVSKSPKEEGLYCPNAQAVDGNTLAVDRDCFKGVIQLRLIGVDAPGLEECGGVAARDKLDRLVESVDEIQLVLDSTVPQVDRRGRGSVVVLIGESPGTDVGLKQIRQGYALVGDYRGTNTGRIRRYEHAESRAREQNLGIWSSCESG